MFNEIHFTFKKKEKCHFTHLRFALFVFGNPSLLKIGVNLNFCSSFMSLSSQNKKKKNKKKKTKENKI